jgi:hydrogenase maturation protein HypF
LNQLKSVHIWISGIVQGVGFRPFVYSLATDLALKGWVKNTSAGVEIEVDGSSSRVDSFIAGLREKAPPLSQIDEFLWQEVPINGYTSFEILHSESIPESFQPISPDVSICPDCLRELFDPTDRRYLYPFINCTNCGPRFTIIEDIPYDRPKTTMAGFTMCLDCSSEYTNPLDRRFHAQPIACPKCGPQVWLEIGANTWKKDVISMTQSLLKQGNIVAIKGIGGFHLACDATNARAVTELRTRKLRVDKPFALMMPDIATIQLHCRLSEGERLLLESRARPIVILDKQKSSSIVQEVAPNQSTVGVMLPYTPLHYLLFSQLFEKTLSIKKENSSFIALVMTSANLSEEPIAYDNSEARQRLDSLADAFLMHNRPIRTRCDDSVMRLYIPVNSRTWKNQTRTEDDRLETGSAGLIPVRRSRGYAPYPVLLSTKIPSVLAVGGELKNTFCITRDRYGFLSHYIGDLENYETLTAFEDAITHYERLFRIKPQAIAYDLHPDYLATRYALKRGHDQEIPTFGVQHHHAHVVACLAENGHPGVQPVIGISFDGTGYGEDGTIWGSEFLIADFSQFKRSAYLLNIPLPGGDKSAREPWRVALSWLHRANIPWDSDLPPVQHAITNSNPQYNLADILLRQIESGINSPLTSSMGRLFDAAASLIGLRHVVNYEAQAAIELEAIADISIEDAYPFEITTKYTEHHQSSPGSESIFIIDPSPIFLGIIQDIRSNIPKEYIAARFQNSIAEMVLETSLAIRDITSIFEIALSGGVWQNIKLLSKTLNILQKENFKVYLHSKVPCNDGGLALGQAVIVAQRLIA